MAERKLTAVFDLVDRMSGKAKSITKAIGEVGKTADKTSKSMDELGRKKAQPTVDVNDRATSKMQRINEGLRRITGATFSATVTVTDKATSALDKVRNKLSVPIAIGVGATGLGVGAVAKDMLTTAMDFEKTMSRVKALSQPTEQEFAKMNDLAIELGQAMTYSSSQVAEGMVILGAAGLNANQMMGALPAVLNSAAASGENFAETADLMIGTMSGMQMQIKDLGHIGDVMAKAALASTISMTDFGYTMKYVAPIAATAGQSLEAVAAATAILGNANIKADTAGTSLRMGLLRMAAPPKEAAKAMDKLSFSAVDATGKFKPMNKMIEELHKRFAKLSQADKLDMAKHLFGVEAAPAWITLIEKGADEFRKMEQEMIHADGAAAEMAKTMNDNVAGAVMELQGAWEAMQIKGLKASMPILKELTDMMTNFTEGSIPKVEALGQRVANVLKVAFEPFEKPEIDKATLNEMRMDPEFSKEMQHKMELYNMDFEDKVNYAMNKMTEAMQKWLDGPGGQKVQAIFEKMAEIGFNAWITVLQKSMETSMNNLMQGNLATAGGAGMLAYILGGGLLLKGGTKLAKGTVNAGKKVVEVGGKIKEKAPKRTKPTVPEEPGYKKINHAAKTDPYGTKRTPSSQVDKVPKTAPKQTPAVSKPKPTPSTPKFIPETGGAVKTATKVIGKAALPVAIGMSAIDIATSEDKVKATGEALGGLAGASAGAAAGAALGSFVPVIGNIVGGLIGGAVGYALGELGGGKAVDMVRNSDPSKGEMPPPVTTPATANINSEQMSRSFAAVYTNTEILSGNLASLGTITGMWVGKTALAMTNIESKTNVVDASFGSLGTIAGYMTGKIALRANEIDGAMGGVQQSLNRLAQRIDAVKVSNVGGVVTPPPNGVHARGISNIPFDGYRAILHRGETVLPREQAELLRQMASGRTATNRGGSKRVTIQQLIGSVVVQNEADEDRLIQKLVNALSDAFDDAAFNGGLAQP
jgi:TP901 family phage tail tape measure protein